MKNITTYQNKKVLVLGLAKTGYHVALLLVKLGADVTINDGQIPENLHDVKYLESLGVSLVLGSHPLDLFKQSFDLVIKNPGIPYTNEMVKEALKRNIRVITDIELTYQVSDVDMIGITGTNGKTTTTTLLNNMLKHLPNGGHAYVAGNIGIPATQVVQEVKPNDVMVMELSSFQLMGVRTFRPSIAVIVNTYSAHIDYHGTREAYVHAKLNLIRQQKETDRLVLNADIAESKLFARKSKANVYYFSKTDKQADAYVDDAYIVVFGEKIMPLSDIKVPGEHNVENILAASLVAVLYGQTKEKIQKAVQSFTGVKHRSQYIDTINERTFYNDSKATNILATQMALRGFEKQVILIAGGLDRGNTFDELVPELKRVKTIILYGQTKEKLKKAAEKAKIKTIVLVESLEEAVESAYNQSDAGDTILFSPACASWDQFPNFEIRGDTFIQCVTQLKNN